MCIPLHLVKEGLEAAAVAAENWDTYFKCTHTYFCKMEANFGFFSTRIMTPDISTEYG